MWIHLNPVGGIAGDMFIAAVLDSFPDMTSEMVRAMETSGIPSNVKLKLEKHETHAVGGKRFKVFDTKGKKTGSENPRRFPDILKFIDESKLDDQVKYIAQNIFTRVAEAESSVHRVDKDNLSFHELGEWDSIVDILGASYLIHNLDAKWSFDSLPLGRGTINTAHGVLPVPAPATAYLLRGLELHDDGVSGERVTPTGAAILSFLKDTKLAFEKHGNLERTGIGFGTRIFANIPNILRVVVFTETDSSRKNREQVGTIEFELDDQTPEHLAIGLEKIRGKAGVYEAIQLQGVGKKGRLLTSIRILCAPELLDTIIDTCFLETTTLGVRVGIVDRIVLKRKIKRFEYDNHQFQTKLVYRNSSITAKVEADDLLGLDGGQRNRDLYSQIASSKALEDDDGIR